MRVNGCHYVDHPAPLGEVGALLEARAMAAEGLTVCLSSHVMSELALTAEHVGGRAGERRQVRSPEAPRTRSRT